MTTQVAPKYAYRVVWSLEDEEFVGLCAEFPGLSHLAETQVAALQGIVELVEDVVRDMQDNGEPVPEPLALKNFSGKFMLRTTPEMHRKLAMEAAEQHVSLSRLVNSKLSSGLSGLAGRSEGKTGLS